jgi:hypothetical protein
MTDVAKLREDHAELVRLARRLATIIEEPVPPSQLALFDLRRQLTSTLIAHLKAEDWVLYPRLLASPDPRIASTARAFDEEMGGLSAAYVAYTEKWSATAIEGDWPGYCTDSRAIIEALSNRIVRENRELLPLLDGLGRAA